jgi:flagellar motor switch protein FliN
MTMDGSGFSMPEAAEDQPAAPPPPPMRAQGANLKLLQNIDVRLSVEVGGATLKIRDLLNLNEGSVVELDRQTNELLEVYVNGTLLARGEVVTVGDRLGIRVTDIVSPGERVKRI